MNYPPDFPDAYQPPVDAAMAEAEGDLRIALQGVEGQKGRERVNELASTFVIACVRAFGRQACQAGAAGDWSGPDIRRGVDEYLRLVIVYTHRHFLPAWYPGMSPFDAPGFTKYVREAVHNSDEWQAHLMERATVARARPAADELPKSAPALAAERRTQVDEFLRDCNRVASLPREITKTDIWRSVGHKSPRQFQHWQAADDDATGADDVNFGRTLAMHPTEFVALLKSRTLL